MTYEDFVNLLHRVHQTIQPSPMTALQFMSPTPLSPAAFQLAGQGDVLPASRLGLVGPKGDRLVPSSGLPSWMNLGTQYAPKAPEHIYNNNEPSPLDGRTPAAPAIAASGTPTPQPRPPEASIAPAPQPDLGWFKRNAYLQTDPVSGSYLDPSLATQANATTGPDLIKKFMGYLQNKDLG
jgi:hypothetical protein